MVEYRSADHCVQVQDKLPKLVSGGRWNEHGQLASLINVGEQVRFECLQERCLANSPLSGEGDGA
ncbi:hypothetical protein GCM10029964_061770 [Kibdelosporangium lantanae]